MDTRHYNFFRAAMAACLLAVILAMPMTAFADMAKRARDCGVSPDTVDAVLSAFGPADGADSPSEKVLKPFVDACDAQLPIGPLEDKLAEGVAKRVAPPLIIRALDMIVADYGKAKALLLPRGETVDPRLLEIFGSGLAKGVPETVFHDYINTYGSQPAGEFETGAEMGSLLVQAGFDWTSVRSLLDAGFDAGSLSPQWRYFVRIVLVARQRGVADPAIAEAARAVLAARGVPTDVPARLGFTGRNMTGQE